jgi:glycosyltransferase involved in cell wall biosynthesis
MGNWKVDRHRSIGDVAALRVAMQRLVSDDALRERLGHHARERSDSFTARAVVPRFERLYERLGR